MIDKIEGFKAISWYIVIGTVSGVIQMSAKEHKHKNRFEKFCVWLTSFSFAVFVTPTFVWLIEYTLKAEVPESVRFGICFFSGQFGERLLIFTMNIYRALDWKSIILAIINRKKDV